MYEKLNILIFDIISRKIYRIKLLKKENMCILYKMNVVVTRSPFEAARNEVDVSEKM